MTMHDFKRTHYDAGVPWTRYNAFHDLTNGNYMLSGSSNRIVKFAIKTRSASSCTRCRIV